MTFEIVCLGGHRCRDYHKACRHLFSKVLYLVALYRKYTGALTFENTWQAPFSPMRWLYDLEEGQEESEAREREGGRERERDTHGGGRFTEEQLGSTRRAARLMAKQLLLSVQIFNNKKFKSTLEYKSKYALDHFGDFYMATRHTAKQPLLSVLIFKNTLYRDFLHRKCTRALAFA
jgi:hypothetical protein